MTGAAIEERIMEIEAALVRIKAAVGPRGWVADPGDQEPYLVEARRLYRGATRLVVRPASTAEAATVVRICAEAGLPIVPQGGNTGLVGGGVPPEDGHNIVLALGRMNHIRAIDPVNFTMTVEAGCILAHLQQAAAETDRLFPLSLGAEGSCQIGGNLSTNAGGIAVLRYGNTRELTLGLEVVLADGRVWDGLRGLRKDNNVLLEMSSSQTESGIRGLLERLLEAALDEDLVADGVIAESGAQANELWHIREAIVEAQLYSGSIKHDVSVPVSRVAEFIIRATAGVTERLPGIRPMAFGHVGDGNIHFNLTQPEPADTDAYLARWQEFNDIVHGVVRELQGSISAEHGVGRLKRDEITHYKSPIEIELMRRVKRALDPGNIMNPGKLVSV
jgi:FAD/FMN-containing dehydrogenase